MAMERQRYEKLKMQEQNYTLKRNNIIQKQKEEEEVQLENSDTLLNKINDKLNTSTQREQIMQQTTSEKARK